MEGEIGSKGIVALALTDVDAVGWQALFHALFAHPAPGRPPLLRADGQVTAADSAAVWERVTARLLAAAL